MSDLLDKESTAPSEDDALNPGAQHEKEQLERRFAAPAIKDEDRNTSAGGGAAKGSVAGDKGDGDKPDGFYRGDEPDSSKPRNGLARLQTLGGVEGLSSEDKRSLKYLFRFTRRRSIIGAVIALVFGGGGFLGLTIGSGPALLIHAAELMTHEAAGQEGNDSSAIGRMTRYYRAFSNKDVAYTRVGLIGAGRYSTTVDELKSAGITIEKGPLGRPTAYSYDQASFCKNDPSVCKMSQDEFERHISGQFGIPEEDLTTSGGKVTADISTYKFADRAALTKTNLKVLGDGKVMTYMKFRNLSKAFGLDSIFHPLRRAVQNKIDDQVSQKVQAGESEGQATEEAEAETDTENSKALTEPLEAKAAPAQDEVNGKKGSLGLKIVGVAAAGVATACIVHDTADAITTINRDTVELPAAAKAVNLMAIGSQLQFGGNDVTDGQVKMAYDDAKGLFKSPAFQALGGSTAPGLKSDLPKSYAVAFSDNSTAANIGHYADAALGGPGSAKIVCNSKVQLVAGGIILVGSAVYEGLTAPETGGASTFLLVAGASLIESAATGYVTGQIIGGIQHTVIDNNTVKKVPEDFYKTEAGATAIASGARLASNMTAITSGGILESNNDSTQVGQAQLDEDKRQFASESMFARMFDIKDYRSLLGHLSDDLSPGPLADLNTGIRGITNVGSMFSGIFSSLLPKVSAGGTGSSSYSGSYQWGFGQYGIPDFIMNDPAFEDPYTTAINAANFFQTPAGQADIVRAKSCFGQQIGQSPTDQAWDTVPTGEDVDPHSSDYIGANCNPFHDNSDAADKNWALTIMFVFYTMDAKTVDCYAGGGQSCQDIGVSGSDASSGTLTSTNYKNPIIDQQSAGESVLRDSDGTFQLYATGDGKIQHWTSKDAVHWNRQSSLTVSGAPPSTTTQIWKPSVTKINNIYFFSYAGGSGGGGGFNIYYGTSSSPNGPVKYGGKLATSVTPDKNGIDPQIYDDNGQYYLYYTNGHNYGIRGFKLNVNGNHITAAGSPKVLVTFDASHGDDWTIEAPYVINRNGYYYMFFSTGDFQSSSRSSDPQWHGKRGDYMVHVARATSPLGPFTRKPGNDIVLQNNDAWVGPGTTTMFTDDANQDWMIYAARYPTGRTDRVSMLDKVTYGSDGWPLVNDGNGPSSTTMPGPQLGTGGGSNPGGQAVIADTYGPACTGKGGSTYGVACTGQCVDYVEYLLNKTYNSPGKYGSFGTGANTVPKLIATYGFKRDTAPQVGDVLSYPGSMTSTSAGHTAAVIKVNNDGSIVVAEWNWTNNGPITLHDQYGDHSFDTRLVSAAIANQLSYAHTNLNFN